MPTSPLSDSNAVSNIYGILRASLLDKKDPKTFGMQLESLGRLKRELIWTLGEEKTHGLLFRWGYSCGQSDGKNPLISTALIQGMGHLKECRFDEKTSEWIVDINESNEAMAYPLFYNLQATRGQCTLLAGYLTGLLSVHTGFGYYFIETECAAQNHAGCRFKGRKRSQWIEDGIPLPPIYEEDNLALELNEIREQLKMTKDRYQNLFEQASVPIFIIDPDSGSILNINFASETLTGFSRENLLTMNIFDLCHPKDHQKLVGYMQNLSPGEAGKEMELLIMKRDQATRIISQASNILSYGGQHVIQTIMRDVTDIKIAARNQEDLQKQLLRSERLSSIGRLAASMAHELKNPLGAIRNALYYIRSALTNNPLLEEDPNLNKIMKLAEGEVDTSVTIISDLLDFSREIHLNPRKTQINELIEELPMILAIPENIDLNLDLNKELPLAFVDPDRLKQVFSNMLENAIHAMPNGGPLNIATLIEIEVDATTGESVKRVTITFEDTGVGISPEHLAKIFEPLFTTKTRGTGLGLAISHNIIEKHGGTIHVTSQLEKGTRFTITLPLISDPDEKGDSKNDSQ
jgi:PAS domain S-box-containing protein